MSIWGSSDINPRGEDLLACCVSADLNFYNVNVGNKPTFRTKTREEVLFKILSKIHPLAGFQPILCLVVFHGSQP